MTVTPERAKELRALAVRRRKLEAELGRAVDEMERKVMETLREDGRLREVAELVGLSHTAILKIKKRSGNDG